MRYTGYCSLLVGLTLSIASAFAQAPAQGRGTAAAGQRGGQPGRGQAPTARGPQPAAPVPAASPAKPLGLEDLQRILASGNDTNAKPLETAPLAVELEEEWLTKQQKDIPISSMPATYRTLLARVPPGPALADVERAGPGLIDQLKRLVVANDRDGILKISHSDVSAQVSTILEMFDPSRYKKHVLGKFADLPGTRNIGVPVYVFPSDAVEKFYFVIFSNVGGKLAVRDVHGGADVADVRLKYEKDWAIAKLKDLFRDLNQNSDATAKAISTPKLYEDIAAIGGWKRLTRRQRIGADQAIITASVPLDGKSVRVVTRVTFPTPDRQVVFDVDFERFGNELLAVRLRDTKGKDIAVDTDMDCQVFKRYQETGACEYKTNYTDELPYLSIAKMKDYAQKAIEDMRIADLSSYANELETSFTIDETKGLPLGLRATVHYMNRDYAKVYEVGSSAVSAGGEVYFPLMHKVTGGIFSIDTSQPLQKMTLGVSTKGLHYYASYQSKKQQEVEVPAAAIKGLEIDKGGKLVSKADPYLVVKVMLPNPEKGGRVEEQTWNLMAYGSSCAAPGTAAGAGQIAWVQSEPCPPIGSSTPATAQRGLGRLTGGLGGGGNTQKAVTLLPENWDKALEAVVRMYDIVKSGAASGSVPAPKPIR